MPWFAIYLFVARIIAANLASPILLALTLVPQPSSRHVRQRCLAAGVFAGELVAKLSIVDAIRQRAVVVHVVAAALSAAFSIGASAAFAWSAFLESRRGRTRLRARIQQSA